MFAPQMLSYGQPQQAAAYNQSAQAFSPYSKGLPATAFSGQVPANYGGYAPQQAYAQPSYQPSYQPSSKPYGYDNTGQTYGNNPNFGLPQNYSQPTAQPYAQALIQPYAPQTQAYQQPSYNYSGYLPQQNGYQQVSYDYAAQVQNQPYGLASFDFAPSTYGTAYAQPYGQSYGQPHPIRPLGVLGSPLTWGANSPLSIDYTQSTVQNWQRF